MAAATAAALAALAAALACGCGSVDRRYSMQLNRFFLGEAQGGGEP
jgi:hypothetical protein